MKMLFNAYHYTECSAIASGINPEEGGRLYLVDTVAVNYKPAWPMLRYYAIEMDVPVVCVSTELSGEQIARRMAILENALQSHNVTRGGFHAEMIRYGKAIMDIGRSRIAIVDDPPGDQEAILKKALASAQSIGAQVILFDVIYAFEIGRLREFANEAGIPVIGFSNNPLLVEKVRGFFDKVIELV